jgi:hypothetical protein
MGRLELGPGLGTGWDARMFRNSIIAVAKFDAFTAELKQKEML